MSLEERLSKYLASYQSMLLAKRYLDRVKLKLRAERQEIESLEKKVEQNYRDVERLENLSVHLLFRKILGDVEEQKEQERQEYLESVLQLRDRRRSVHLLQFERGILQAKVKKLPDLKQLIERLIKEREHGIEGKEQSAWSALFQELDDLVRLQSEIQEVRAVGLSCKAKAEKILALLQAASARRDWCHRKNISDYSQEKTIVDEAVEAFSSLKVDLLKYEEELKDVYQQREISLSGPTGKFDRFVEVYYNYLINDWIVRERISSIISMMEALLAEIIHWYELVERKAWETTELINKAESRKSALLIREIKSGKGR